MSGARAFAQANRRGQAMARVLGALQGEGVTLAWYIVWSYGDDGACYYGPKSSTRQRALAHQFSDYGQALAVAAREGAIVALAYEQAKGRS